MYLILKLLLKIVVFTVVFILTIYFIKIVFDKYYSSKYDKMVAEYLIKNKSALIQENMDTIYVTDNNFHICSQDSRNFVDKKITRPAIEKILKNLGYRIIIFTQGNSEISINGGQSFGISTPIVRSDKPCYGVHIWTTTFGLIPKYEIEIDESFFLKDSVITEKSIYTFSIFGDNNREIRNSKEGVNKDTDY